jgi:predicted RNA-binding Zn-ribbon protein involved in translation (DUF1610 family)
MDGSNNEFLLILCTSCDNAHGARKVAARCPRCGSSLASSHKVLKECDSATELQKLVMLRNMPEELRDGFHEMLEKKESIQNHKKADDKRIWPRLARKCVNKKGEINVQEFKNELLKNNQESNVNLVLEELSFQGFLLKSGPESWMLLE